MRLRVFSDLHLDFGGFEPPPLPVDCVVLAGDIHTGDEGLAWARRTFGDRPIVYVLGNHECYGRRLPDHVAHMVAKGRELGIHVLEQGEVRVGDVVFLGCTLWTDMGLFGSPWKAATALRWAMADYRSIEVGPAADLPGTPADQPPRLLQPTDTIRFHREALAWLRAALARLAGETVVVVTHHAPSGRSLDPHDRGLVRAAYASPLDGFVAQSGAALWIHGHTHFGVDYWIGKTRVVCNARGYLDEPVESFDPRGLVEVKR
ncbi:MAG: metallophosphoesterase [Myxococcales bacterium]|nr:metallophosphoesterase [Myxococcales bacterium]